MCVFCDIVNKEIPAYKLYEDEYVIAFLDLAQVTRGHTVIITKRHVDNVLGLKDEECASVMKSCRYISNLLKDRLDAKGFNLINNSSKIAGQSVMHFHMHVIPRYQKNEGFSTNMTENQADFDELDKLCKLLTKELNKIEP